MSGARSHPLPAWSRGQYLAHLRGRRGLLRGHQRRHGMWQQSRGGCFPSRLRCLAVMRRSTRPQWLLRCGRAEKWALRWCAECDWPQSGLGHEPDDGRRVGGKRDHASIRSMAGHRTMAWGPCQVVVSDAKALLTRATRESGKALLL
jgi:hypothetical protein